jgi:hypothetical protein
MDTFRAFEEEPNANFESEEEPTMEAPPEIGVDERRMHVRAYNYWVSLLNGRAYPSIEDVEPQNLTDFGPHSVLLDFSAGSENPAVVFIGRALREECGLDGNIRTISDVPSRSLLSRLTDHYLQIIANCAPIGFEAEFVSQNGHPTLYRGILMPLSSDGDTIDFIYGVINWKEVADSATTATIAREINGAAAVPPLVPEGPIWTGDGADEDSDQAEPVAANVVDFPTQHEAAIAPAQDEEDEEDDDQPSLNLDADAGLADRLCLARETAEAVRHADARSRTALYRALGDAYDFALAAEAAPEDYSEILEDAGLKAQERAPMTPVVKLIFGIDYDKTRLTEFSAALSYGRREAVSQGGFTDFLGSFSGGLKGVVAAERAARRPAHKPDNVQQTLEALRQASPLAHVSVASGDEEFVLLVARRQADGTLGIVAPVAFDRSLLDRAFRKARL